MRARGFAVLVLLSLAVPGGAALAATVPDDYPTIQAAIDAGATQVFVKEGVYHERLLVTHDLELLPASPPWSPMAFPRVDGLEVRHVSGFHRFLAQGIHFTGPVKAINLSTGGGTGDNESIFVGCRMDSGFVVPQGASLALAHEVDLRGCMILGEVYIYAYYQDIAACTIVGGGLSSNAHGWAYLRDNLVIGPAPVGIRVLSGDAAANVTRNLVRGTVDGIVADYAGHIYENVVEDCSGDGLKFGNEPFTGVTFAGNTVRRCGGNGITVGGRSATVAANTVEDVGGVGIQCTSTDEGNIRDNVVRRSGSHGIVQTYPGQPVFGNTVIDAGGDGIVAAASARWNVVGRSAGRGIVAPEATANTSYANGGAGFDITGSGADSVAHNIAYANLGVGLNWSGTGTPTVACNDWFANLGGATGGIAPGPTDLAVDPQFCDLAHDDVTLSATSPLAAAPGCGSIGARAVGCATPLGLTDAPAHASVIFEARPMPSSGATAFVWRPEAGEAVVEVFDLQGARRWSGRADASTGRLEWSGVDAGGAPLMPGVYFARMTAGAGIRVSRVVIAR